MHEMILILDFGSQYTQLIARRIREQNVYCEIHPWNKIPEIGANVKGVILSGSPFSVREMKRHHVPIYQQSKEKCLCWVFVLERNICHIILVEKFYLRIHANTEERI
jgi:GMP synthase (glutamine-hydrolysing)